MRELRTKEPPSPRRVAGLARHEDGGCRVCAHPQREAIEAEFVRWKTLREIQAEFDVPKDSVARHARARGLEERRSRNVRGALVRVVEKGIETAEVSSSSLVAAATALAKMGESDRLTERVEISGHLVGVLGRMNSVELDRYARTGVLPPWAAETGFEARSDERKEEAGNG
jgi:hypothetical protein